MRTTLDMIVVFMFFISIACCALYCFLQDISIRKLTIIGSFIVFMCTAVLTPIRLQTLQPNNGVPIFYLLSQAIPFILCLHFAHKQQFLELLIQELGGASDEDE